MTNKSNAEVAQEIAESITICGNDGQPDYDLASYVPLAQRIESALVTAQSNFAKEVLAEIDVLRERQVVQSAWPDRFEERLRDLFSRLGISVDEGGE